MKILHVIGGMDRGGAESYIMNTLRNIDRKKYQCDILVFLAPREGDKYFYQDELKELGVNIIRVPDNRFRRPLKFIADVQKVLVEGKYDAIHSHIDFMSALTLTAARKAGVKKRIAHSHNTNNSKFESKKMRVIAATLRRKLNREVTDRLACGIDAGKFLYGSKKDFTVIHNGIDLQKFRYNSNTRNMMRAKFDIDENAIVLLNVGRFEAQKNQEHLIDLFGDYVRKDKAAKLVIIGEGSLKHELEDKIASERLGKSVILLSAQGDMERFYSMADVFMLPSLFEGVPTVGIEAQASGMTCLFSDKVPKETKLLDTAKFLPLDDSWNAYIVKPTNRAAAVKNEKVLEYDIKSTVKALEKVYDK